MYIERRSYVHSGGFDLFVFVRRPRWRGPARLEHQFGRVEQHGCREKIMNADAQHH